MEYICRVWGKQIKIIGWFLEMEKKKKSPRRLKFNTVQTVVIGFFGVILGGGILLSLPICNQKPIEFIDALFTSVSSVCVTGLVTIVPAEQFTLLGKIILLLLIQVGGLGVIACMSAFFLLLGKKINMKGRITIQQAYGLDTLSGLVKFVIRILKGTFLVEGIGAVLFSLRFIPEFGFIKGVGYAIFHSVSAFCNAGIDILGSTSFIQYSGSWLINFTTMFLIVMGGLGFPVWHDIAINIKKMTGIKKRPLKWLFTRLCLQSKIVLTMTGLLILCGAVGFFLLEFNNPETMGDMNLLEKMTASLFQSVTTRTAGFATVPQGDLRESSKLLGCMLMFIGGSPAGTAGGVKTTTIAMLLLTVLCVLKNKRDTECFARKIDNNIVRSGITITMINLIFLMSGITALTIFEPGIDFLDLTYEAASAMGTVGLTADLTPILSRGSHVILMILMYVGRIGPLTMALALSGRSDKISKFRELPEENVMLG